MDPAEPQGEIARLRVKLAEVEDPEIRALLQEKIAVLERELPKAEVLAEPEATPEPPPKAEIEPEEAKRLLAQLTEIQRRADTVEDEDVREELNREAVRLRFMLAGRPLPSEPERAVAETEAVNPEAIARAENLIREARVERMRSNNAKADALMQEAAAAAPNSVEVLSALGDESAERKQSAKAREFYQKALSLRPNDPSLERKLGDLVLRLGPARSVEDQLRSGLTDSPFLTPEDAVANARTATVLSFFCPGLGQIVMGKTWSGIATFIVWALMIVWILIQKDDVRAMVSSATGRHSGHGSMLVLLPIFIALAVHFGAVASCASAAKGATKKKVDRPVPPMNLPFE